MLRVGCVALIPSAIFRDMRGAGCIYPAGDPMPLPRWLARFNLRVTNRILGPLAERMPGMGIVVHQGRKTNRQYRTPVMVFRHGDQFVIALTYGPQSQWVKNVLAQGGCDFETRGRSFHLTQPRLIHDERRSLMPLIVRFALAILKVSDFLEVKSSDPELRTDPE